MRKFEVWYMRPEWFPSGIMGAPPDASDLAATHIHLTDIMLKDDDGAGLSDALELIYAAMQGEAWSPNGEARSLIIEKGLIHTSMSMGDCVIAPDGRLFMVAALGFEPVQGGN